MLVMELTDNSLIICRELGLSGFVAHILGIVKQFTIRGTLITKVQYIYLMWWELLGKQHVLYVGTS